MMKLDEFFSFENFYKIFGLKINFKKFSQFIVWKMSKEIEKSFKRKNLAPYLYFKKIEEIFKKDQLC